jgi:formylglycine-generating enzyme required for sulfatase activity
VRPIRDRLRTAIEPQFSSSDRELQIAAANVLADLFHDQPEFIYTALARRATPQQLRSLIDPINGHQERVTELARADLTSKPGEPIAGDDALRLQTNAFLVLYAVASPDLVPWQILRGGEDNTLRTEIIESLSRAIPEWEKAALRLEVESDPLVRQALLLALAEYPVTELTPEKRAALQALSLGLYESDASPGVHAAARQFVEKSGGRSELAVIAGSPVTLENRGDRAWYRNGKGQEFAIIEGPVEFLMGAPSNDIEQDERGFERQHRRLIPRSYAIGLHEVTVAEFQAYDPAHFYNPAVSPEPQCPITEMSWIDAAKYCRWLSEQEGVSEAEMCFPPIDEITVDMQLPPDVLSRTGYRLPTAAEWEYACRAGTATSRWIGKRDQARICAWYLENSDGRTHPVGEKMPNGLGLFDTLGNAYEYCQDKFFGDYPVASEGSLVVDGEDVRDGIDYELRGACYQFAITDVRSSMRDGEGMTRDTIESRAGFRLARTIRAPQTSPDNTP